MLLEAPRRRPLLISLTPLIDVVFILLVFFMLVSNLTQWRSFPLATGSGAAGASDRGMIAFLQPDGTARLGERTLAPAALAEAVVQARRQQPDQPLAVVPETQTAVTQVVRLLDALAAAGVEDVRLLRRQTPAAD
ncbi:MAG: biopolymer transporter ExbD [Pseudomonadota bacterium]|nr:biopolymer transporter ExbD [Pseudomonadota bacterium]HJO35510.1 biopolymer transporter ExbD [Gammaproteobacteria bacterium]